MKFPFNKVSNRIFQILKGYGYNLTLYDEEGNQTLEPVKAFRFFAEPSNIMVSILDDGSDSTINMYLSGSSDLDKIKPLMKSIRMTASKFNLGFNLKKYGKELTAKDFAYQNQVSESYTGSSLSSYQAYTTETRNEARVVIKHSGRINPEKKGARGRNIKSIYVEDCSGVKHEFPVKYTAGAKAMARHISRGGQFDDKVGNHIIECATELFDWRSLNKKLKENNIHVLEVVQANIAARQQLLKDSMRNLIGSKKYNSTISTLKLDEKVEIENINERIALLKTTFGIVEGFENSKALRWMAESVWDHYKPTINEEETMSNIDEAKARPPKPTTPEEFEALRQKKQAHKEKLSKAVLASKGKISGEKPDESPESSSREVTPEGVTKLANVLKSLYTYTASSKVVDVPKEEFEKEAERLLSNRIKLVASKGRDSGNLKDVDRTSEDKLIRTAWALREISQRLPSEDNIVANIISRVADQIEQDIDYRNSGKRGKRLGFSITGNENLMRLVKHVINTFKSQLVEPVTGAPKAKKFGESKKVWKEMDELMEWFAGFEVGKLFEAAHKETKKFGLYKDGKGCIAKFETKAEARTEFDKKVDAFKGKSGTHPYWIEEISKKKG